MNGSSTSNTSKASPPIDVDVGRACACRSQPFTFAWMSTDGLRAWQWQLHGSHAHDDKRCKGKDRGERKILACKLAPHARMPGGPVG
jgi:hypothetical protein